MGRRTAIIIGAGPAGLTAAYELCERTDIRPLVFEAGEQVGGLSRTVVYAGNRMDIGGHRFFSKSDRVMEWWTRFLPIEAGAADELHLAYRGQERTLAPPARAAGAEASERVLLVRERVSRILFRRRLFSYPISPDLETVRKLGWAEVARIGASYARSRLAPRRPERSLEDFFVNRFGDRLYRTFFRDYTEKVWGVPCAELPADWGAQRVKGLSVASALSHALRRHLGGDGSIGQKRTQTSLIERFLYPKYGPGQMWEEVARRVRDRGGEIRLRRRAVRIRTSGGRVTGVDFRDSAGRDVESCDADLVISTMPVPDLVAGLQAEVPEEIRRIAAGLMFRDFITVGLLVRRLRVRGRPRPGQPEGLIPDNWIYVQEPDVRLGRIQIFNNWSPALVRDPEKVWLGLEYFCDEGDEVWSLPDDELRTFAVSELARIGLVAPADVLDGTVLRVPKTYPAYLGTYERFGELRAYLDRFPNLFLLGRNGMHRYNNQDHSMLTAMTAVDGLVAGRESKDPIWAVNTEPDYHEER